MRLRVLLATAIIVGSISPGAIAAGKSRAVWVHKNWQVRSIIWPDRTQSCAAVLTEPNADTFAVYTSIEDKAVKLQFDSKGWDFGSDHRAFGVRLKVDGGSSWQPKNASYIHSSLIITLPNNASKNKLISELSKGTAIDVYNGGRTSLMHVSLSGAFYAFIELDSCAIATRLSGPPS